MRARLLLILALLLPGLATGQTLSRQEVARQVAGALALALQEDRPDLHVAAINAAQDLTLPDGEVSWQTGVDPSGWQPGTVLAPVIVRVDGREVTLLDLPATLTQRLTVPVLRQPLSRGGAVSPEMVEFKEVTLTQPQTELVVDPAELTGLIANQPLRPGQPLLRKAFTLPTAVKRGEVVRVRATQGGLTVETKAVAMHSGMAGEVITLRNPKSYRDFTARVTGPGEAVAVMP